MLINPCTSHVSTLLTEFLPRFMHVSTKLGEMGQEKLEIVVRLEFKW